jgi:DNA recombination protein RmuC
VFAAESRDALKANSEEFSDRAQRDLASMIDPLKVALDQQQRRVDELERERQKAYGSIETLLVRMTSDQNQLQSETANLVKALRQPQVRGRWGEIQLRQVVELAGMSNMCDFDEQQTNTSEDGKRQRPDLLVRLPNQRRIVVDSKVPLSAYLESLECTNDAERAIKLDKHAAQVRSHVNDMHLREYQDSIDGAYDFLVLFIPGEVFYRAALEHDLELLEYAFKKNIILATPTTLIALLKAVALGWREARLATDAQHVKEEGEKIYRAISTLAGYIADLGKSLKTTVGNYNKVIGNVEVTLFTSARRMRDLEVSSLVIAETPRIEEPLRDFSRQELLASLPGASEPLHSPSDHQPLAQARYADPEAPDASITGIDTICPKT